jgi:hypothetical protein
MAYSECPQVDNLTHRLVNAYRRMTDSEIASGAVVEDLHIAIMEHKEDCPLCKRILVRQAAAMMPQRVA